MIEGIKDLGLNDLDPTDKELPVKLNAIIVEKLGISVDELKERMSKYLVDHAEDLTVEIPNIAPLGDFGNLIEDNEGMAQFLKTEACKLEHWILCGISEVDKPLRMLRFDFACTAVDDGESCTGKIFLGMNGKIKHAMVEILA